MKAVLIKTDGTVLPINPTVKKQSFTLDEMYKHIGCDLVEHVQLAPGVHMWCDEEGLLKPEPEVNRVATSLYRKANPHVPPDELGIVGNVILEDRTKFSNYFASLVPHY